MRARGLCRIRFSLNDCNKEDNEEGKDIWD